MEQLYTIKETMNLLKVSRQTVYNWNNDGKISFVYVADKPRIKQSELKKLIKEEK